MPVELRHRREDRIRPAACALLVFAAGLFSGPGSAGAVANLTGDNQGYGNTVRPSEFSTPENTLGDLLHWSAYPLEYAVNGSVAPGGHERFATAVEEAFARWSAGANVPTHRNTSILPSTTSIAADGVNAVVFSAAGTYPFSPSSLGITFSRFQITGQIVEADIFINGGTIASPNPWSYNPNPTTDLDLESTLTHEIGHLLGLAHSISPLATLQQLADLQNQGFPLGNTIRRIPKSTDYNSLRRVVGPAGGSYQESSTSGTLPLVGTPLSLRGDNLAKEIPLPFEFPFFGVMYSRVFVSTNGFVNLEVPDTRSANSASALKDQVMIAPYWCDLRTDLNPGDDVYTTQLSPDIFVIRWQASVVGNSSPVNVGLGLFRDGTTVFAYGSGNTGCAPTVGVSNFGQEAQFSVLSAASGQTNFANRGYIVFAPTGTTPKVSLGMNQASFAAGQTIQVTGSAVPGATSNVGDLYFSIGLPDGTQLYYGNGAFWSYPVPLLVNLAMPSVTDVPLFSYTFGGTEPTGTYMVILGLYPPGQAPVSTSVPISASLRSFRFSPTGADEDRLAMPARPRSVAAE